jgi:hypothetical protein
MTVLTLMSVMLVQTSVTIKQPVQTPLVHTSVLVTLVMPVVDKNVKTLTNVPKVHTHALVTLLNVTIRSLATIADVQLAMN